MKPCVFFFCVVASLSSRTSLPHIMLVIHLPRIVAVGLRFAACLMPIRSAAVDLPGAHVYSQSSTTWGTCVHVHIYAGVLPWVCVYTCNYAHNPHLMEGPSCKPLPLASCLLPSSLHPLHPLSIAVSLVQGPAPQLAFEERVQGPATASGVRACFRHRHRG